MDFHESPFSPTEAKTAVSTRSTGIHMNRAAILALCCAGLAATASAEQTYSAWIAGYPDLPSDKRGLHDDPDTDGASNALEYALDTDPSSAASVSHLEGEARIDSAGPGFSIRYRRRAGGVRATNAHYSADGVTYVLETTASLSHPDWQRVDPPPGFRVSQSGRSEWVRVPMDMSPQASEHFVRLSVVVRDMTVPNRPDGFDGRSGGAHTVTHLGRQAVTADAPGHWIRFDNVDFGRGMLEIVADVASAGPGAVLEVRADAPDGRLLATIPVPDTGSGGFQQVTAGLRGATGIQNLYLVFQANDSALPLLERFRFSRGSWPPPPPEYRSFQSPSVLLAHPDDSRLFIAGGTSTEVLVFDTDTDTITRRLSLPTVPTGLALSADGTRLYVTGSHNRGYGVVCELGLPNGELLDLWHLGHMPVSPVVVGDRVWMCDRFGNAVRWLEPGTGASGVILDPERLREPIAAVVHEGRLFVANHQPIGRADDGELSVSVQVIDTASASITGSIPLPDGSLSPHDLTLSPDGSTLYVPHMISRYRLPTTQIARGWQNGGALSLIDTGTATLRQTLLLDDIEYGAPNPHGVACGAEEILITLAGSHELVVLDRAGLDAFTAEREQETEEVVMKAYGDQAEPKASATIRYTAPVKDTLYNVSDHKHRIRLRGNGPRAVVARGGTVYVAEYFSDSLSVVQNPGTATGATVRAVPLVASPALTPERRGEQVFHDATIAFQRWQSCASCHPGGRADSVNWDLGNDGWGNPKQNRSMLLAAETPPMMALGVRQDAETAIQAGFTHISLAVVDVQTRADVLAYIQSLEAVPSPHLEEGRLSDLAVQGRNLFQVHCATCHPPPLFTDLKQHNRGTGRGIDAGKAFDTPSLVEVWRTAPYGHDGRFATLREAVAGALSESGTTLTAEEIDRITDYVKSIGREIH